MTGRKDRTMKNDYSDDYKVEQLRIMRKSELDQPENERYGAHLTHWSGKAFPINLDAGALDALIRYYGGEQSPRIDPTAPQIITFAVNNGITLRFVQEVHDGPVFVQHVTKDGATLVANIFPGDFVMLWNWYEYVKTNDLHDPFINPNGKNTEA